MAVTIFTGLKGKDKVTAIEHLISGSTPSDDFFLMIVLSILMATFGFMLNSTPVVIGSMLIAPMLYPVLSLSLGVIVSDLSLVRRSVFTICKSFIYGAVASTLVTWVLMPFTESVVTELVLTIEPSLIYVGIAIIAGFAASFALLKPERSETLPGIVVSAALIPPVAAVGIGIASQSWHIVSGGFTLFLINIGGITFASMIVFALVNLYSDRKVAHDTAKKEDKKVETLHKKAEKEAKKTSKS